MVSIITAAFRTEYIGGTWESLKKQTYKKWEWIVVNDNSSEIFAWYKEKKESGEFEGYDVWFIDIGKRQGRYGLVARNLGAMSASYNNIIFLDDDNNFEGETYLESVMNAKKETGRIPFTNLHLVGKKKGSTYDRIKRTHPSRNHVDLGNILYSKKLFLKYGYFDDSNFAIVFDGELIDKIRDGEGEDAFVKVEENLLFRHKRY